jgi:hypothetical protein
LPQNYFRSPIRFSNWGQPIQRISLGKKIRRRFQASPSGRMSIKHMRSPWRRWLARFLWTSA